MLSETPGPVLGADGDGEGVRRRSRMRRLLEYELDGYLHGRGSEVLEEMPLMRVENQPYIHYNKGSLVMYALQRLHRRGARSTGRWPAICARMRLPGTALPQLAGAAGRPAGGDPRFAAPTCLEDMFETITLFDNRAGGPPAPRRTTARFLVKLEVEARKLRADGAGQRRPRSPWTTGSTSASSAESTARRRRRTRRALPGEAPYHRAADHDSSWWSTSAACGPASIPTTGSSTATPNDNVRVSRNRGLGRAMLTIENLSKTYANGVRALKDVSLDDPRGDVRPARPQRRRQVDPDAHHRHPAGGRRAARSSWTTWTC